MKKLGIVGGLGPSRRSTTTVRSLRRTAPASTTAATPTSSQQHQPDPRHGARGRAAARRAGRPARIELELLARAGADLALISANTPHIVFDEIQRRSPIPIISIVEATSRESKKQGIQRPALFGTKFTMRAGFYPDVLAHAGIEVAIPEPEE
jgi:aspartate racemase